MECDEVVACDGPNTGCVSGRSKGRKRRCKCPEENGGEVLKSLQSRVQSLRAACTLVFTLVDTLVCGLLAVLVAFILTVVAVSAWGVHFSAGTCMSIACWMERQSRKVLDKVTYRVRQFEIAVVGSRGRGTRSRRRC